jgi:chromosome segregation ATPase
MFYNYKEVNEKEINSMISELNTLRRHSNVRQDQLLRSEKKLKDEIKRLKSQLESQSDLVRLGFQKQISKLHSELAKKNRILGSIHQSGFSLANLIKTNIYTI